ncbi:hypothetical protein [Halorientalis regularis]|uniref:SipW-cognate class signal peptide n=1 Tax=Halorientalis regularis TaxID=660518 RepID=A0A1G7JU24_9EURY|nr:hypothetical protein [Halorientalis regularis]SDF28355.1 hypothetical protein SAMN05216218_10560 [Halorientalis regularis]
MSLTRRHVLASLAAGGAGALTGTGSAALLGDTETGRHSLTTGLVDLRVEYWLVDGPGAVGGIDPADPDGVVDGPRIDVPVETLDDDEPRGSMLVRFALPQPDGGANNPASLWLRTACPEPDPLAEFLELRLSSATADGTVDTTIAAGSLRDVTEQVRAGVRLDPATATDENGCLTDETFLLVEYDLGLYVGDGTTSLPLYVAATQCRNADPATNPFGPIDEEDCPPGYVCDCCWAIGKVEIDDGGFDVGRTYEFTEGVVGYGIRVTDTDGDDAVAFELVATDGGVAPPLCEVRVKGGRNEAVYGREPDTYGTTTDSLDGNTDGLVSTPANRSNGDGYGISYVLVKVCAPETGWDCPDDLVRSAASGGGPGRGR